MPNVVRMRFFPAAFCRAKMAEANTFFAAQIISWYAFKQMGFTTANAICRFYVKKNPLDGHEHIHFQSIDICH